MPTPEDAAEREQLRGIGQELVRVNNELNIVGRRAHQRYSCWYKRESLITFLQATDADLHIRLSPYDDVVLLEAHGEQVLDLFIRLAPQQVWVEWLRESLKLVASAGRGDMFTKLFAVNGTSFEGWNPLDVKRLLSNAATGGSIEVVSALLAADGVVPLVREVDEVDRPISAIFAAARNGHRSIVAALVDAGAPLEYKHMLGGTVLTTAVENGHDEIVVELLAAGADVNNINDAGVAAARCGCTISYSDFTPLCIATAENNKGMVDILLAAGAHLGEELTETSPLHLAAERGFLGPLESLLGARADVNLVDSGGRSALHMACCALHVACWYNHERAVELLLRYGARPNPISHEGLSPADCVGMGALKWRETSSLRSFVRDSPATLDAEETSVADRISAMLRGATAWGRRGWLVVLRARHQPKEKLVLLDSSSTKPPSLQPRRLEQPVEAQPHSHRDNEDAGKNGVLLSAVPCTSSNSALPCGVASDLRGVDDQECGSLQALEVEGDDRDGGACTIAAWKVAVQWLVQVPVEHGAFREVLSFF
ncbi:unnamed protein product [Hapterophycus canaliculatus]